MARTSVSNPSEFALVVGSFRERLMSLSLSVSGATTGLAARAVVDRAGVLSSVGIQSPVPGPFSATTYTTVVAQKIPNGSATPITLVTATLPGATTPDLLAKQISPASSTSAAAMAVDAGDIIVLRFTTAQGNSTTSYGPIVATVAVDRDFDR